MRDGLFPHVEENVGISSENLCGCDDSNMLIITANPLLLSSTVGVGSRESGDIGDVVPCIEAALVNHHSLQIVQHALLLLLMMLLVLVLAAGRGLFVHVIYHEFSHVKVKEVKEDLGVDLE